MSNLGDPLGSINANLGGLFPLTAAYLRSSDFPARGPVGPFLPRRPQRPPPNHVALAVASALTGMSRRSQTILARAGTQRRS